ncbi:MAG TPA: TonB-dependent receptor plug domain-containing protein, partial [Bacteroidales bacterium]|nr:TonB-dependent receptor plug domain-containing protein [Bacteroidales bacterium]
MNKKQYILVLSMLLLSLLMHAQEDSTAVVIPMKQLQVEHLQIPEDSSRNQIISAGRISRNISELPLQVYVITEEEIQRNQYNTLTDVMLSMPGVQVSRPGTGEFGETFQVWNLTGNLYTKILINGIPVKPSVVAGMPVGSQLPVRQAERIEFIYGNASAVYGADAVSGVINIITKKADQGTFVRGDMSLGRSGHNYMNFSIGGKGGKNNNIIHYSFYGSRYEQVDLNIDYTDTDLYNPLNYYRTLGDSLEMDGNMHHPDDINASYLDDNSINEASFIDRYYGVQYNGSLTQPSMAPMGTGSNMLGMQLGFRGFSLSFHYMYRNSHSSLGLSPVFYKYDNPQNYWGEHIQEVTFSYEKEFGRFSSKTQISSLAFAMDNNSSQGLTQLANAEKVYRFSASNDLDFSQIFTTSILNNLDLVLGLSYVQSGNLPPTNYLNAPFDRSEYGPFSIERPV